MQPHVEVPPPDDDPELDPDEEPDPDPDDDPELDPLLLPPPELVGSATTLVAELKFVLSVE